MENQINRMSQHYGIPNEARKYLFNWDNICPSPYNRIGGGSWYNNNQITWDSKPEGALRLSDHWNFFSLSGGGIHCPTLDTELTGWALCKMSNGFWETVIKFEKKTKYPKHFESMTQNRFKKMDVEKKQQVAWLERESKINKAISNGSYWAILNRNVSEKRGRNFSWHKEVTLVQVFKITSSGGLRDHNGSLYKAYESAKYYFRKPTSKALSKAREKYLN